jgi:hypothetical protein
MTNEQRRKLITELAARQEGVRVKQVTDTGYKDASKMMEGMVREGLLVRHKVSHKCVVYHCAEWKPPVVNWASVSIKPRMPANFPPDAEPIITEKTKITICPSPKEFHVKQFSRW